ARLGQAAVKAALRELPGMFPVVLADAKEVPARAGEGGVEPHRGERHGWAGLRQRQAGRQRFEEGKRTGLARGSWQTQGGDLFAVGRQQADRSDSFMPVRGDFHPYLRRATKPSKSLADSCHHPYFGIMLD